MADFGFRDQRATGSLLRASAGATAIEFAIVFPVFLVFVLGIVEFGRALWTQTALQSAVETAARCAAVNPTSCTPSVTRYAASQAFGLSIPAGEFTYTAAASCGVAGNTKGALVVASHVFDPIIGQLVPGLSVTLTARSCHP